jgi:hypothetical protein
MRGTVILTPVHEEAREILLDPGAVGTFLLWQGIGGHKVKGSDHTSLAGSQQ